MRPDFIQSLCMSSMNFWKAASPSFTAIAQGVSMMPGSTIS
jgi:hypothetical protein